MAVYAGRPTKCTPAMAEKAIAYLNGDWQTAGQSHPSILGLALFLGVARQTILNWADDESTGFLDITREVKERGEMKLLDGGLDSSFNSAICKLALSKHGYHERSELAIDDISMLSDTERTQRVAALLQKGKDRASSEGD